MEGINKKEDVIKEKNLEAEKDQFDKRLIEKRNEKKKITRNICDLQNEIEKIGVEIDFLNNYVKFSQNKEINSNISKNFAHKNSTVSFKRLSLDTSYFTKKQQELNVILNPNLT